MRTRVATLLLAGLTPLAGCAAIEDTVDEAIDAADAPHVVAAVPNRPRPTTIPVVTLPPEMPTPTTAPVTTAPTITTSSPPCRTGRDPPRSRS